MVFEVRTTVIENRITLHQVSDTCAYHILFRTILNSLFNGLRRPQVTHYFRLFQKTGGLKTRL